ncbi:IS5 family transposase [Zavarzinia sp.]|uniref:IS5 family transposase n=1 Tax=Zavarzinia sp. TaxID=2027920 RepID=UPI003BB581A4
MGQPGFFDLDERYRRLSETGDPLVKLASLVDFEIFRPRLVAALKRSDGSKGGRPPYDPVLMFKILILQTLYTLSDDATEFQIRDRLSFMRFLRLGLEDAVPDAKTIWLFREQLTRAGAIKDLFAEFDGWLKGKGYLAMSGQIVDASIIAAPRQRKTDEEKAALKEGRIPEDWQAKPAKLAQKDRDARWTLKRAKAKKGKADGTKAQVEIAIPVFGYKNHIGIDKAHRLIRGFAVTSAAAHDGAQLPAVIARNTASDVWADTAYRTKANEAFLSARGLRSRIHFRRRPGQDLSGPQKKANRARSKVRSAVEGVFAHQKQVFGLVVRTIGMARATTKIALANLAYNVRRYIWLTEHQPAA